MPPAARLLRVVLDTNVLFSALAFPADSPPSKVLSLVLNGNVRAFVSPFIVDELERNLRDGARWDEERLLALRRRLRSVVTVVRPRVRLQVIKRLDADNRILECAVAADADILITGDLRDLRPLGSFRDTEILTPREFLTRHFPRT